MNPRFPIYIVSKGRADSRMTSKALEAMRIPYFIVIEEQELDDYAAVIAREKILILEPAFQRTYDTCDELGDTKSRGPGPARNFAWAHSIAAGHAWHWVMDDNIRGFRRLHHSKRIPLGDGTGFRAMEDFCLRYANVAMAGPNYSSFATTSLTRTNKLPPIILNTRIYSCNLIRNDVPFRWRGRYNEDTDLSLRMLKAKWCTVQFNAFLQNKIATQSIKGGNTDAFYAIEGTLAKSRMQVRLHPDVSRLTRRFGRIHHFVDYRPFRKNRLMLKDPELKPAAKVNDYGLQLRVGSR